MHDTFLQIKAADELGGYDGTCFHNSADALASVLELVRQHKVGLGGRGRVQGGVWGGADAQASAGAGAGAAAQGGEGGQILLCSNTPALPAPFATYYHLLCYSLGPGGHSA